MASISKGFALFLTLIIMISSLTGVLFKTAFAQSSDANDTIISPSSGSNIPTPTVPNFIIEVVNSNIFSVIITNQPFTPFNFTGAGPVQFLYSIRVGLLNATADSDWTWLYDALGGYPTQSNGQTTTITINLTNGNVEYGEPHPINVNSQFLIEVDAIISFYGRDSAISPLAPYVIYGEASGWSNAETVNLPATASSSPSPTPTLTPTITPTSTVPEFPTLIILTLFAAILLPIVFFRKRIPNMNLESAQRGWET